MSCLLDYLAQECGAEYLSDLKITTRWKKVLKALEPGRFPLRDWNEAANYLNGAETQFDTCEEAKAYLLK